MRRTEGTKELARVDDRPLARSFWVDPWDDIDRMFEDFFGRRMMTPRMGRTFGLVGTPSVDITDEGDHLLIKADMPGVPKENVKVEIDKGMLEIKADMSEEHKEEDKDYVRRERRVSSFYRSFALSDDIDHTGISASMKDGVLMVTVPRRAEAEPRKVEIKVD